MTEKVKQFLENNKLTDIKFEQILKEVTNKDSQLKLMIAQTPLGWQYCNTKVLERILDIYDNSQIDLYSGKIIEINFE